jgi:hypothetical protein
MLYEMPSEGDSIYSSSIFFNSISNARVLMEISRRDKAKERSSENKVPPESNIVK